MNKFVTQRLKVLTDNRAVEDTAVKKLRIGQIK